MQRLFRHRSRRSALLNAIAVAFVAFGLLGCQTNDAPSGGSARLRAILDSGKLRVGLTGDQPPLNMRTRTGRIIGLDVDLMDALAGSMNLETELIAMPFIELLGALERGEVDVVASAMTITPERNVRVAFAGPYYISGKSMLTKSREIANVRVPDQLNDASRTFAALAGSTSQQFVEDWLPNAKLVTTTTTDEAIAMVIGGKVDAMVGDVQVCTFSAWKHPKADLYTSVTPFTIEPLGIALPADAPLLVNLVENHLKALEYSGVLGQLKARWLTDGPWIDELP